MTTSSDLMSRVRTNINEPATTSDPLRTDQEIYFWLDEALFDYMHKVPQEHFPELTTYASFLGSNVALPDDYMFFHGLTVARTYTSTLYDVADCFLLSPGETYLKIHYPGSIGAFCQVIGSTISTFPNVSSGTLTYVRSPAHISTNSITFEIGHEHETPIINYATAMALGKVNDADASAYMALYNDNVAAKAGRKESGDIERA